MKRQTKKQRFADFSDAMICLKKGERPHRLGGRRKDGSIPTKPVIPIENPLPEKQVLAECLAWLKRTGIKADRLNNGSFCTAAGWHTYGIMGGADIVGLLPNGRHLEVEVKKGLGGLLSVAQQKRMKEIQDNQGLFFVVHSVEELERRFNEQVGDEEMLILRER